MSLPDPQHNSKEDKVNTTKDTNQEDMERVSVSRNQEIDTRSDDASCCETHIVSPAAASCQDDEEGNSTTTIESRQNEVNNAARQQEDASIVELEQQNENAVNVEQQQGRGDLSTRIEEEQQDRNTDILRANDRNSPEDALMTEEKGVLRDEDRRDEEEHRSLKDKLEAVLNERQELIQKYLILQKMLLSLKISNPRGST